MSRTKEVEKLRGIIKLIAKLKIVYVNSLENGRVISECKFKEFADKLNQ